MSVPFLKDQRLSLLDPGHPPLAHLDVAAAERRRDRGGFQPEGADSPWKDLPRAAWLARVTADLRRVVLVADAGLGKTTNCEWMAGTLPRVHRGLVPFLLPVEQLPESADDAAVFNALLARWRLAAGCSESAFPRAKAERMLASLRASGRLALVLDSLDQALSRPGAVGTLTHLMTAGDWGACPLVVSTRPHALASQWAEVFAPLASAFRFVRVEEMDEKQQRHLLGAIPGEDGRGVSRYDLIPAEGRRLLGVPRVTELIRNLGDHRQAYAHLETMTDVYWKCTGTMLRQGLEADAAGDRLEWSPADGPVPNVHRPYQVDVARSVLGAAAFEMLAGRAGRPNLAHEPAAEMAQFLTRVLTRMSKARREHERHERDEHAAALGAVDRRTFTVNFNAVAAMNAGALENYFLDAMGEGTEFKFRNPTMQAFFAAVWACRHGTPEDVERLKGWVVPPRDELFGRYEEFWRFVSELGDTGGWDGTAVRPGLWADVIGVVYRSRPVRLCEFVWRSWRRVGALDAPARAEFLAEWPGILAGDAGADAAAVGKDFMSGYVDVPAGSFLRGSDAEDPDREPALWHVTVSAFRMHKFAVTTRVYQLFDPCHPVTASRRAADPGRLPVTGVSWYEAWCFAAWCGGRLPTEAEWEYACRAGKGPRFSFHDEMDEEVFSTTEDWGYHAIDSRINCYIPRGYREVCSAYAGSFNGLHLHNMHGNVWEWCADWYHKHYYSRSPACDPAGPEGGSYRVCRGGSFKVRSWECTSGYRGMSDPGDRRSDHGFRLAADADGQPRHG